MAQIVRLNCFLILHSLSLRLGVAITPRWSSLSFQSATAYALTRTGMDMSDEHGRLRDYMPHNDGIEISSYKFTEAQVIDNAAATG